MRYKGLKGKAWDEVKASVRRREKDCYTCPRKDLIANGFIPDVGHYRPVAIVGSNNQRAWWPQILHLQCKTCNGAGQGEQAVYRFNLVRDYGETFVAEYDRAVAAKQVLPVKNWQEVIDHFKSL